MPPTPNPDGEDDMRTELQCYEAGQAAARAGGEMFPPPILPMDHQIAWVMGFESHTIEAALDNRLAA